jgi:proteasome lid subunit RPN8/RPN11
MKKLEKFLTKDGTKERCGLILSRNRVVESENVADDPVAGFEVDPHDLVKYDGKIVGTWHTHPGKPSAFSQADYFGFAQWPDLKHWIVGTDGVRCYAIEDGIVVNAD